MIKIFLIFILAILPLNVQRANLQASPEAGTWESPFSGDTLLKGPSNAQEMQVDSGTTYWGEVNSQGNISIISRDLSGKFSVMTPPEFNVGTTVHEYGGGAFTVVDGTIYASNREDQALYVIQPGQAPRKLTSGDTRFADLHITPYGLVAIGEHHGPNAIENFLALIDVQSGSYTKLASGYDFYSSPAVSHDGKKIAWISWNYPNMPWTNTELWIADFDQGKVHNERQIGGFQPESFFQPQWSPDNVLYFVTDRDKGWWNVHRYVHGQIENVAPMEAEVAEPQWRFDLSTYAFLGDRIIFTYNKEGRWYLGILDPNTKIWHTIKSEGTYMHQLRADSNSVEFLEQYPDKGEALVQIQNKPDYPLNVLHAQPLPFDAGDISAPQHIAFPSQGHIAFGYYYPPKNKNYQLAPYEKPPLIVMLHGGPTAQASSTFDMEHQFWTSRGYAVLDVNYGGSTGYGRHYRSLLDHEWGVVDVEDCVNGALFLVQKGLVDPHKLAIRGGSAGGYTTLAALAFKKVFTAGASYYGVADITALARDTHKFEKRYMEQLVGKYPEDKELWQSRSPLHSVDKMEAPLIIFQGDQDPIVPPNQSEMIYEALKSRGVHTELHLYAGEGHGFRQPDHLVDSITREAQFYLEAFHTQKT